MIKTVDYLPTIESSCVGVDIETSWGDRQKDTADPYQDRMISVQVYDGTDVFILQNNFSCLIPLLTNPEIKKIFHNYYFDGQFLTYHLGVRTRNVFDTLLTERVINTGDSSKSNDLASVVARRLGITLNKETRSQFSNHTGPLTKEQIDYAAADTSCLLALRESQIKDVSEQQLGKVVALENAFVHVLVRATLEGIGFDHELWDKQQRQIYKKIRELETTLAEMVGLGYQYDIWGEVALDMNLGSTQQLQRLLKDKFGVETHSTSEESLKEIPTAGNPELAKFLEVLLEHKDWQKRSTWHFDTYCNKITGNIHANINQLQARTGRMSVSNPNLQQVPSPLKTKEGDPMFRDLFLPKLGYKFVTLDYNQQEPRIFGQISGDPKLREACSEGDVYVAFGKFISGKEEITKQERFLYKTGTLASLYGAGPNTLSIHMGISVQEATEFKQKVRSTFPVAAKWSDAQEGLLKKRGFTLTLSGRRQNFPQLKTGGGNQNYFTVAVNYPNQGSGADLLKLASVYLDKVIEEKKYSAFQSLFVHDEMVSQAKEDQADLFYYDAIGCMETAGRDMCPDVKIIAEGAIGDHWSK